MIEIGDAELASARNFGLMSAQFSDREEHLPRLTEAEIKEVFFFFFWCTSDNGGGETYERRFGSPDADPMVKSAYDLLEGGFVEGYRSYYDACTQSAK